MDGFRRWRVGFVEAGSAAEDAGVVEAVVVEEESGEVGEKSSPIGATDVGATWMMPGGDSVRTEADSTSSSSSSSSGCGGFLGGFIADGEAKCWAGYLRR